MKHLVSNLDIFWCFRNTIKEFAGKRYTVQEALGAVNLAKSFIDAMETKNSFNKFCSEVTEVPVSLKTMASTILKSSFMIGYYKLAE